MLHDADIYSERCGLMRQMVECRKEQKLSQRDLAAISDIKQPHIARLEVGNLDPTIGTLLRVLMPMGKTLTITDIGA